MSIHHFKNILMKIVNNPLIRKIVLVSIPFLELVSGLLIFIPSLQSVAIISIILLLVTFIVVSLLMTRKEQKIDCNCFGSLINEQLGWPTIIRNSLLIILVLFLVVNKNYLISLEEIIILDLILSVLISIGIILFYACFKLTLNYIKV